MQTSERNLAQFIPNPLSSAQEQRILRRLLDGKARRPRSRAVLPGVAAAIVLAAALLLLGGIPSWRGDSRQDASDVSISAETRVGRWYATGDERMLVVLQSGRQLELQGLTQLNVLDDLASRARLERGTVRCEGGDERLTIEAGNVEVYCDGESLSAEMGLEANGPYLAVSALSGPVTLRYEGTLHTISPGKTWTTRDTEDDTPESLLPSPPAPPDKAQDADLPVSPGSSTTSAKELWKDAQDARLSGETAEAARAFSRLMTEFPSDSRAGLAAFELGRIQLDGLGNPGDALRAFDFAIQQGRAGYFVEDAAAGRVTALSRMGSRSACEQAREAFLREHASSPHTSRIRALCSQK